MNRKLLILTSIEVDKLAADKNITSNVCGLIRRLTNINAIFPSCFLLIWRMTGTIWITSSPCVLVDGNAHKVTFSFSHFSGNSVKISRSIWMADLKEMKSFWCTHTRSHSNTFIWLTIVINRRKQMFNKKTVSIYIGIPFHLNFSWD